MAYTPYGFYHTSCLLFNRIYVDFQEKWHSSFVSFWTAIHFVLLVWNIKLFVIQLINLYLTIYTRIFFLFFIWAAARKNQQNDLCSPRRLRSAWAFAQSDQSSQCAQWVAEDQMFFSCEQRRLWSDWVDAQAQADLSLCCAQRLFCYAVAHLFSVHYWLTADVNISLDVVPTAMRGCG